jgi:hypothetical protein
VGCGVIIIIIIIIIIICLMSYDFAVDTLGFTELH